MVRNFEKSKKKGKIVSPWVDTATVAEDQFSGGGREGEQKKDSSRKGGKVNWLGIIEEENHK